MTCGGLFLKGPNGNILAGISQPESAKVCKLAVKMIKQDNHNHFLVGSVLLFDHIFFSVKIIV